MVAEAGMEPVRMCGLHLEMLGRILVGNRRELVVVLAYSNFAVTTPGFASDLCGRPVGPEPGINSLAHCFGERQRSCKENRGRGRPVLSLAKQVGCKELGLRRLVRDDEDLGRAGN